MKLKRDLEMTQNAFSNPLSLMDATSESKDLVMKWSFEYLRYFIKIFSY